MLRDLSLASLKYNQKMFDECFRTITLRKHKLVTGEEVFTANAILKEGLIPPIKEINHLYSDSDGSGTSTYRSQATYKAISEAMERYAFYSTYQTGKFGFDIDGSTSGMAAFPALFKSHVRDLAYSEAIERWSLSAFWNEKLDVLKITNIGKIRHIYIRTPFVNTVSVISTHDFELDGEARRAYGFSASSNESSAAFQSTVEMSRNVEVLTAKKSFNNFDILNLSEKRLIYFSRENGIKLFDSKIELLQTKNIDLLITPKVVVDSEIRGPWSKYCTVHRILLDGMGTDSGEVNEFFF